MTITLNLHHVAIWIEIILLAIVVLALLGRNSPSRGGGDLTGMGPTMVLIYVGGPLLYFALIHWGIWFYYNHLKGGWH
jgi:hypothetical protein